MSLKSICSLKDCTKLKQLILENPDLPLIAFAGEDAWQDIGYGYTQADVRCDIEALTLYSDMWCDEDDYRDRLSDNLADEEEYKNLSDEDYEKMIDEKVKETEFVKAIVIWVG